jgi:RecB family exonuclease
VAQTSSVSKVNSFVQLLAKARAKMEAGAPPDEIAWVFWEHGIWKARLCQLAGKAGMAALLANRDLDSLMEFFAFAGETGGVGAKGVKELLAEIAAQQIPADNVREDREQDGVWILTVNRARGREWAFVVVAGVEEGQWPALRRGSSYLQPEMLTKDGLGIAASASEQLQEQRRAFYGACATASAELVITAPSIPLAQEGGAEAKSNQPSRFLAELAVDPSPPLGIDDVISARAVVVRLRRRLLSQRSTPEVKAGAAQTLALLGLAKDESGEPLIPAADPRNWWGVKDVSAPTGVSTSPVGIAEVVVPQVNLSPSAISVLLECPRRYFLDRKAHADRPASVPAQLGSLIHSLLEHAQNTQCAKEEVLLMLDQAFAELAYDVPWVSQGKLTQAHEMISRFYAREQACHKAQVSVMAVEAPFDLGISFPDAQVNVLGKIDRVERTASGDLRVVDFKTGQLATSKESAKSDQLAVYQLAILLGTVPALAGSMLQVSGGTMVFLGSQNTKGLPIERFQSDLSVVPDGVKTAGQRKDGWTWIHDRLRQACDVVLAGVYPALASKACEKCAFSSSCPAVLAGSRVA